MKRILLWGGAIFAIFILLACAGLLAPLMIAAILLFGWITFPFHTFPQMTVEPAAIAVAAASLLLLLGVAHGLARWLYGSLRPEKATARAWRLRWSVSLVAIVVLLFASGICLLVTIHQIGWLATSEEPIVYNQGLSSSRVTSVTNLSQIGLAFLNYHHEKGRLPPAGTPDRPGQPQHSWETMLLPYLDRDELKPNLALPWDHPENAKCFKTQVPVFLNPRMPSGQRSDEQGYALSHYAVNSRVVGPNPGMRVQDVTDGAGRTILAGEVNANFKPWGHPVNGRDPALGLNTSPDGFGGPSKKGGANFLMLDRSVHFISNDIDPAVLRALSTPTGDEKLPAEWEQELR